MTKSRFQGISLDSFLQMVQMDKTSCTLRVESQGEEGFLYVVNGELVDAECYDLGGPDAAIEIVSWRDVSFEFENICDDRIRRVNMPLMHLLMEGLKRRDDREAGLLPERSRPKPAKRPSEEPQIIPINMVPDLDIPRDSSFPVTEFSSIYPSLKSSGVEEEITFKTVGQKSEPGGRKVSLPLIIGCGIGGIIVLSVIVFFVFFAGKSEDRQFKRTMALVEKSESFAEKETILRKFMDEHKDSELFDRAGSRLEEIGKEKASKELDDAKQEIARLSMDDTFVDKAKKILDSYLKANPESIYKEDASKMVLKLPEQYEDASFAEISKAGNNPEARAEKLSSFISKFPAGRHYDEAKALLSSAEEDYYRLLVSKSGECIEKDDFSPCTEKIEAYRKIFGKDSRKYAIENLFANMAGGRELANLRKKADSLGDDLGAKKDLFYEYLRSNTDNTGARRQAKVIVDEIEKEISERKDWESTKNYATNSSYPLKERARRLESFIARKPDSIYAKDASRILVDLGAGKVTPEPSPRISQETRPEVETKKAEDIIKSSAKSSSDFIRAWSLIEQSAGDRFKNNGNGTFQDTLTGKIWCLLDSKADIGRCLNYRDSLEYVRRLNTGGYSDWRLPTAAELYSVYKNPPALPDTGAQWYWSSDAVWRGLNEIARVVRPGIEREIRSETLPVADCGYVRAIRN